MKRRALWLCLVLGLTACTGCPRREYAKALVARDVGSSGLMLMITGTGEQLIKAGRIDLARKFKMPDKTDIDVWLIKARPAEIRENLKAPRGTVLVLHEKNRSKASYLGLGELLAKKGFDVVLPDLRGHGRSGGKYITYGVREKLDVKAVLDQLLREGTIHAPIYVFGVSLGGAVAVQYAAIAPACKGVLAMSPYRDARAPCRRAMTLMAPLTSIEDFEATLALAGKMAKFDPADASTVKAAGKLRCPIHLVHGLIDLSVPLEDSQAVYDAAGEPKKLTVILPHEQLIVAAIQDAWVADRIDELAKGELSAPPAKSAPNAKP